MKAPLTTRGLLSWIVGVLAVAFAAGAVAPMMSGWLVRPDPMLAMFPGLAVAISGLVWLFRRERSRGIRVSMALFAYTMAPVASCAGEVALIRSPLQPMSYGVRPFDEAVWKRPAGNPDKDRGRSRMTAHLLLGGLLDNKPEKDVRRMLGEPDCGTKPAEDAWYLGFASGWIDPDCLHVWYGSDGRVTRARVLQH